MTGLEAIEKHLGGQFIDEEMRQADDFLGRVGWIMSRRKGRREIWYECCGHSLREGEGNSPDEEHALYSAQHRGKGVCPYCSAAVGYIDRNHVSMKDYTQVYTVWYRMSRAEPQTLLVLGMWCGRRWYKVKHGADPREIETEYEPCCLVVLPWGDKPSRYVREVLKGPGSYDSWWWGSRAAPNSGGWVRRDRVEGGDRQSITGTGIEYLICCDLQEAVRGTRWEKPARFAWGLRNAYSTLDRVSTLRFFCTHVAAEYMLGNGMEGLVRSCVRRDGTTAMIRWKRHRPQEMLQMDGNELAQLRRMDPERVSGAGLMAFRFAREYGQRVKLRDVMEAGTDMHNAELKRMLTQWGRRCGVLRILRYCGQQYGRLGLWKDYMNELLELGEANDPARWFPRDLHAAHGETSGRIRYQRDEKVHEQVKEQAQKLQKLAFEACGLRLVPFETPEELVAEGSAQHICIGGYVNQYAKGQTALFKLRRAEAMSKPFHAVEMSTDGKRLIQCRGFKNKTWAEDEETVRAFWAEWDRAHKTHTNVYLTINHEREARTV